MIAGRPGADVLELEILICDPHHHFWDFRSERVPYQDIFSMSWWPTLTVATTCGRPSLSRRAIPPRRPGRARPVGGRIRPGLLLPAPAVSMALPSGVGHRRPRQFEPGRSRRTGAEALQAASPNRFRGIRHTVTWDPHPKIDNQRRRSARHCRISRGARVLAQWGFPIPVVPAARAGSLCEPSPI
jgi:hypothetical protein